MPGCGERPLWHPVIKVFGLSWTKLNSKPLEIDVGMSFCGIHKDEFKPTDIPDLAKLVEAVCKASQKCPPNMESAEVEMRPIVLLSDA